MLRQYTTFLFICVLELYKVDSRGEWCAPKQQSCSTNKKTECDENQRGSLSFTGCAKDMTPEEPQATEINAVVLYQPTFLQPFQQKFKEFKFAEQKILIEQSWSELGVAGVVWDAAVVLCEFLEQQGTSETLYFKSKSILELGAGTGLAGLVAAALGGDVVVTDRTSALPILERNVRNHQESGNNCTIKVKALDWGKNLKDFPHKYDIVLGADIVYIEDTFNDLLETILHLSGSHTEIFLSCRIRYDRDTRFLDMLGVHFIVAEILYDKERGIKLFHAKLR